jgi:hypothetical protein
MVPSLPEELHPVKTAGRKSAMLTSMKTVRKIFGE